MSTEEFYFDAEAADRACLFFDRYLTHIKGEWAKVNGKPKPFHLDEWQAEKIIRPLFGWKRKSDGTRKYRTCYIEIPRKSGKSTLSAGIGLYLLIADKEQGAEVYSAAADREQAAIVFEIAQQMVNNNAALRERAKIYRRSIVIPKSASSYKVLSADVKTKHGFNAHGIIFDELHGQPNRELWDTLTTSTGARRQPLVVAITTAGFDENTICGEIHNYALKVRDGIIDDPTFLPVIYAANPDDDWTDPEVWKKANPGYGVSIKPEYLEQECRRAKETPGYRNTFKRLHLNIWTQQETAWLPMESWPLGGGKIDTAKLIDALTLDGVGCYGGLDLAMKLDLSSLVLLIHEGDCCTLLPFFWIPEETARKRERKDRIPYAQWIKDGFIEATPGSVADYEFIEKKIVELAEKYQIREIAYDPWNATQTAMRLKDQHGIKMVEFRQGYASMNEPSKNFERLFVEGKLKHGDNPVLKWMASNVSVATDPAGNIKPVKPEHQSAKKIDGIVSAIMALGRATTQPPPTQVEVAVITI